MHSFLLGACPRHMHAGLDHLQHFFPSPPSPAGLLSSKGEATHPSLARAGSLSSVCGSAGLGAASWSAKPLPLGTALLAGPLPGVSKTVSPSHGALCHQRASLGPAHKWSAAHQLPQGSQSLLSPGPLAILTTGEDSLCLNCTLDPLHATHSPPSSQLPGRGNVSQDKGRLPLLSEIPVSPRYTALVSLSHSYPRFLVLLTDLGTKGP